MGLVSFSDLECGGRCRIWEKLKKKDRRRSYIFPENVRVCRLKWHAMRVTAGAEIRKLGKFA